MIACRNSRPTSGPLDARTDHRARRDDDAIWKSVPKTSSFREFSPKIDVDPSMQTEFQVAYDARNLYVFLRMHDAHPDSIMHALSRRDVCGPSDQIKLIIDSYVSSGTAISSTTTRPP